MSDDPLEQPLVDEDFPYTVDSYPYAFCCRVRIYLLKYKTVVLATHSARPDADGPPRFIDQLATQVCEYYGLEPERLVWVDHWYLCSDDYRRVEREQFEFVTFCWDGEAFQEPDRIASSREEVTAMMSAVL